ncbi:MAG: AAA family ATPase [Alphaproteobacteria bacterium]
MSSPALKNTAGRPPMMAVVGDEITHATLVRVARDNDWSEDSILQGAIAELIPALAGIETPSVLVVDLSDSADPMADITGLSEVCDPGTRVIALGNVNDVNLYRKLIDFGVQDYLLKPVSAETLNEAICREDTQPEPASDDSPAGRLIAVTGARGGVGSTTIAVNTAWILANEMGQRVALVDLDLFFGSVALALDLESGRGFREALENPNRIDGLFIERAMVRQSDNLFVLAAEESLENSFSFNPDALHLLLQTLRTDFDAVVVDLPRFAARSQFNPLTPPSSVIVVSDPSLAGMRDTMRMVKLAKTMPEESDVTVVVNRISSEKGCGLAIKDFEAGAGLSVDVQIPDDAKTAIKAEGDGKTITAVDGDAKVSLALRQLVERVSGLEMPDVQAPLWRRLLKRSA